MQGRVRYQNEAGRYALKMFFREKPNRLNNARGPSFQGGFLFYVTHERGRENRAEMEKIVVFQNACREKQKSQNRVYRRYDGVRGGGEYVFRV